MRTIQDMVSSEVYCCISSMVATLANGAGNIVPTDRMAARNGSFSALESLCEQALELAMSVDDWEETAIQAGWSIAGDWFTHKNYPGECFDDAQRACVKHGIDDPYQIEVFEHWAVSDWFADKLIAAGEKVDKDFAGLCVWARTTTGQAIYADSVVEAIYASLLVQS